MARLKSIHFLGECLADTTTNAITKLGNDIADSVITPKLRDRFQEEIVKLASEKVRVEIVRSGGKYGAPQYQVRLFAKPDAKVKDILSEGERTCVALAAFLTEVVTATHRSAFVFDDPVSSLDHRWRKQVAKRLVEEAEHRQIVVFTHDLVFVNDLYDLAYQKKRAIELLTVSRGPAGAGVVTQGLPWKAQSVEDRIDKLEKATREAKTLYENDDEEAYRNEAARIYDGLRASWERALEDVAFFRVVQRHRDYIDTKNLMKGGGGWPSIFRGSRFRITNPHRMRRECWFASSQMAHAPSDDLSIASSGKQTDRLHPVRPATHHRSSRGTEWRGQDHVLSCPFAVRGSAFHQR